MGSMSMDLKKSPFHSYFVFSVFAVITAGCAFLPHSSEVNQPQQPANFRNTAAVMNNALPLPVEIAEDIANISENGEITRNTDPKAQATREVAQQANPVAATESAAPTEPDPEAQPVEAVTQGKNKKPGKNQKYIVKRGDTLMKIAYQKYGDLMRWREIFNANKTRLKGINRLEVGQFLIIRGVEYVVIEKNGKPYLIRRRDTLAKISTKVYGLPGEWRRIWKNNSQMIKNPNKIYAGFTLYYEPLQAKGPEVRLRRPSSIKK